MKIYGHFMSAPANQVRLTASAIGAEHQYHHVDLMQGEQQTPEYLAVNPFGKVPALEDDGFRLAESNAISRYIACRADCAQYPEDVKKRAEIDQWMDYAAQHVRANMSKVLFNKVFAPMMDRPVDEKSMAEGREFLTNALSPIEARLGETSFIAGDALTIADTAMMAAMEPFEMIEFGLDQFPNINTWRERNMGEDWYTNVHAHYAAEMQG